MSALFLIGVTLGVTITAQPIVSEEVLEPSVLNEVNHALVRAPTNFVFAVSERWSRGTATERALKLVSEQKGDGRWYEGTNDVTCAAVHELKRLLEETAETEKNAPEKPTGAK